MNNRDLAPLVVPVTRLTYMDGSQEFFVKSLRMVRVGDVIEFHDWNGRIFTRDKPVRHIDDVDVAYGGREEDPGPAAQKTPSPAPFCGPGAVKNTENAN